MNFAEIESLEENFQVATYAKMNIAVECGEGAWIWTSDGEKYLDLYGGHARLRDRTFASEDCRSVKKSSRKSFVLFKFGLFGTPRKSG